MKNTFLLPTLFIMALCSLFPAPAAALYDEGGKTLPAVRVGIVTDGPWARGGGWIDTFKTEITAILEGEYDVRFPESSSLQGDWSAAGIESALDRLLTDPEVDLVLALGHVSSSLAAARGELSKPVVAPFIFSAAAQKLPLKEGASGVPNLNYIAAFNTFPRDLKTFRGIVPFDSLVIIADSFIAGNISGLAEEARSQGSEYSQWVKVFLVDASVEEALAQLPASVEAVVVTSLPRVPDAEFAKLVNGLIARRLPGYSTTGRAEVEAGLLASMTPRRVMDSLARSTAVNVHEILRGVDAGTLPVSFDPGQQFTLNMATARAIDVQPSLLVMTDADLLHEERTDIDRVLDLEQAVREALAANLDLLTAEKDVAAGAQAVRERLSDLLPRVDLSSRATMIDEDRAELSGGQAPEKSWTGSFAASQLIYSDRTWAGYTIEKHSQAAREEILRETELDIIRATASTYLNVLKSATLEKIQKENLKLTRANLERAQVRVDVGIAGPEEIYRWESAIADSRQAVLRAETSTLNAMTGLNRLLHRPLQEEFLLREVTGDDPVVAVVEKLFFTFTDNPKVLQVFRDFMVAEGLIRSPLLSRFEAEIAARERTVTSSKRAFWLPDLSLRADVDELFSESGAGQRGEIPGGPDSTDWSVGVFASIPIFNSGGKRATLNRNREELASLQTERDSAAERVEQSIIISVNRTRSSYPAIGLSRDAAEAAGKNLVLITDSYERGTKSIIDLLDAQNQTLVSDEQAANSGFNFLVDLMNLQRAVGQSDLIVDEKKREDWQRRFRDFARERGLELSGR